MQSERRKIRELVSRYRLEPTIRDVFVEGRCDASVISRFLRLQQLRDVRVYEISSIEIPPERLVKHGLHNGNRGRVIFLAREFEKSLPTNSKAGTCVADRDYDIVLHRVFESPFLLFVDHCCIEMYTFDADTLDNLFGSLAPNLRKSGHAVILELEPLLRDLFAIRATNISLGMNLKWLDSFEESCTLRNDSVQFDEDDFITRYLNKNARLKDKTVFVGELSELRSRMQGDPRLFVRGHDFVNVLVWYLREHCSKTSPLFKKEVLEKFLIASIEYGQLSGFQFFRELVARMQT